MHLSDRWTQIPGMTHATMILVPVILVVTASVYAQRLLPMRMSAIDVVFLSHGEVNSFVVSSLSL